MNDLKEYLDDVVLPMVYGEEKTEYIALKVRDEVEPSQILPFVGHLAFAAKRIYEDEEDSGSRRYSAAKGILALFDLIVALSQKRQRT